MSKDWREEISREERYNEIRTKLIQNGMPVYAADVEAEILLIKEENEKARKQEDKQLELMAKEQGIKKEEAKRQLDIIEKQVKDELDPVNQILNNPDLTAEQKQEAVKQVQEVLAVKEEKKKSKLLLYAGIGRVALIAIGFVLKKK